MFFEDIGIIYQLFESLRLELEMHDATSDVLFFKY